MPQNTNPTDTMSGCPTCKDKNQFRRHQHFLEMSEQTDLAAHLKAQEPDEKTGQDPARITAIVAWARSIKATYGKPADEDTGHTMPVSQVWAHAQRAAQRKRVAEEAELS